ncbi:MAG: SRPBCC family protein, partial [Mycobacteriales bacterium]
MAVYTTTVPSPAAPDVVFRYLADFRSCAEWDPSVRSTRLVTDGDPVRLGARFAVNASGIPLVYETVQLDAPRTVVLRGTHFSMVSLDRITFVPREDGGTDVTYRAQVDLRGPF